MFQLRRSAYSTWNVLNYMDDVPIRLCDEISTEKAIGNRKFIVIKSRRSLIDNRIILVLS